MKESFISQYSGALFRTNLIAIDLIDSQQALQSFIAQTRVGVKPQGMVIEVDDDEETVVDLTKGYAVDEAIDLTSD